MTVYQYKLMNLCGMIYWSSINIVNAYLTEDFNAWLIEKFGEDVQIVLNRADLGDAGSFGGKMFRDEIVQRQPIIFVHGVSNRAHDQPMAGAKYFRSIGYAWSELYGTTYASGAQGNPLQWTRYRMNCYYVKQVRALIVAVRLYTGRAVDVIAFSLGVPVARKAILGGKCVDTGENLGDTLTRFVDTFVGVAGPNHGITLQLGTLALPGCIFGLLPICNAITGLYSGACPIESRYLQDINSQIGYEGRHIFSIYSKTDNWIGYLICNTVTARIPGQHGEKVYQNKDHDKIFYDSYKTQANMVMNHIVV